MAARGDYGESHYIKITTSEKSLRGRCAYRSSQHLKGYPHRCGIIIIIKLFIVNYKI